MSQNVSPELQWLSPLQAPIKVTCINYYNTQQAKRAGSIVRVLTVICLLDQI